MGSKNYLSRHLILSLTSPEAPSFIRIRSLKQSYFVKFFLKRVHRELFKYINRQNNHESGSSYMDILVSRTLYMSCQAGLVIEPGPSALKASALSIELTWQTYIYIYISNKYSVILFYNVGILYFTNII